MSNNEEKLLVLLKDVRVYVLKNDISSSRNVLFLPRVNSTWGVGKT